MKINFTKMHGIGNDYVYVDGFKETIPNPNAFSEFISDRHFGMGADGLVMILPSEIADFRMRMLMQMALKVKCVVMQQDVLVNLFMKQAILQKQILHLKH